MLAIVAALVLAAVALPVAQLTEVDAAPVLRVQQLTIPGLAASAPVSTVRELEALPVPLTVVAPSVAAGSVLLAEDGTELALAVLAETQREAAAPTEIVGARAPQQLPKFFRYEVQPGDSVLGIAQRFGIASDFILWNNIDIVSDADLLTVGDRLRVPSVEGILHDVRLGETLTDIASTYEAEVAQVIAFPANSISDPNLLRDGETLLVVGGKRLPKPAPTLRPTVSAPDFVDRDPSATGFIWPVVDIITSFYGPLHPLGIDINAPFVPVAASQAGQVFFAGGEPCCSYGIYVDIVHGGGYETRYAHLSQLYVTLGEWVEQGQIIGISGNSGRSTGPHLHFEIYRNGFLLNPLQLLP
ncbi:MAG: M23 family metallopeptidase [Chloroflexi bacterium]|nr:M23 family metallopeptidase [Chloroflexota bacterium]